MGLTSSLNSALSGLSVTQRGIQTVSNNVLNAGVNGYHKQNVVLGETMSTVHLQARAIGIERAFNASLQKQYSAAISVQGYADVRASLLQRLEMQLGKPGDSYSLDSLVNGVSASLETLMGSPSDISVRAQAVKAAQALALQLNTLTEAVQGLRADAEAEIVSAVQRLNDDITNLAEVNRKLLDLTVKDEVRMSYLDQRDRLVSSIAEAIDVRVSYKSDDTVSLFSEGGIGVLDIVPTQFSFQSSQGLSENNQYDATGRAVGVSSLMLVTSSGARLDVTTGDYFSKGTLAGLLEMRDQTLVKAQAQLDEMAAALVVNFSQYDEVAQKVGADFEVSTGGLSTGNYMDITYDTGGIEQKLRLMQVSDASALPLPTPDANGRQVIGVDFNSATATADIAASLSNAGFAGITVAAGATSGSLSFSGITSLMARKSFMGGDVGIPLFADPKTQTFTDTDIGVLQRLGLAGRITVNSAIANDNSLLVKITTATSDGDQTRPKALLNALNTVKYIGDQGSGSTGALSGTIRRIVGQFQAYQANSISDGLNEASSANVMLSVIDTRMERDFGVDVDVEMAQLIQLQNAFTANARVMSVVQELMDLLMKI